MNTIVKYHMHVNRQIDCIEPFYYLCILQLLQVVVLQVYVITDMFYSWNLL